MDERNDDSSSTRQPANQMTPGEPPLIPPTVSLETEDDPEKITKGDRIMIFATIVIAFGTLVSAGAICFQWYEMHTGGADTAAIAKASEQQATSARQIDEASKRNATAAEGFATNAERINAGISDAVGRLNDQAGATHDLAVAAKEQAAQAVRQTREAQVTADAAKSAADISSKSLELSQRPWLFVKATIDSALTYDQEGGHITLHYAITNIGHSPATRVNIAPEFYLMNGRKPMGIIERRRLCDEQSKMRMPGQTIFPGEVFEIDMSFSMSRSEIEDAYNAFQGRFFPFKSWIASITGWTSIPVLIGSAVHTRLANLQILRAVPKDLILI